jgi:hypothetical protein
MTHQKLYEELFERSPSKKTYLSCLLKNYPGNFQFDPELTKFSTISKRERSEFLSVVSFLSLASQTDDEVYWTDAVPLYFQKLRSMFPELKFLTKFDKPSDKRRLMIGLDPKRLKYYESVYELVDYALIAFQPRKDLEYFDGEIIIPPWNSNTEPMTYLVPTREKRTWNASAFTDQLFSFNISDRMNSYPTKLKDNRFDSCYDCVCEYRIWELYYLKHDIIPTENMVLIEMLR